MWHGGRQIHSSSDITRITCLSQCSCEAGRCPVWPEGAVDMWQMTDLKTQFTKMLLFNNRYQLSGSLLFVIHIFLEQKTSFKRS